MEEKKIALHLMKEIKLSDDSSVELFLQYASLLEKIGVEFIQKASGLDQRYWDFIFNGRQFTLHLENYLGISILGESDIPNSLIDQLNLK